MRLALLALVPGLTFALAACEGPPVRSPTLSYTADARRAYQEAMKDFDAHDWIEAQELMREVKRKYSYTRYARLAELRIADADFEQEKFADALREYKQFIHDHRSDNDEVEYAQSRVAETQYREISDSILLPASEERDQSTVQDAYKDIMSFLKDYPSGKETPHICALLDDVVARLVKHEIYVARYYLARDNFDATVARLQYAMRNFAGSDVCGPGVREKTSADNPYGLIPDTLLLLGETYLRMHRYDDARTAFDAILHRYPESALGTQARRYLDLLQHEKPG